MNILQIAAVVFVLFITGCIGIPNTYYSITDDYVRGLRWYDRGDYDSALNYLTPLVEKGDCDAEALVGLIYAEKGTEEYREKAFALWIKSANGNQQRAQWFLGDMYNPNNKETFLFCKTCEKDIVESYKWYRLFEKSAKYYGEKKYVKHIIPKIEKEMTKEQIAKGNFLVKNWKPTPKDCEARHLW